MIHENEPPADRPRIAKKRAAKADAILEEAMKLLAEEGIEALTLGRLAQRLGYVPAALYRYFASKDALLAALQRRAVAEIHQGLLAALDRVGGRTPKPPDRETHTGSESASLARILAAARFYLDLPRTHPEAHFLVATLMGDPRPLLSDEEARRTAPFLTALLRDVQGLLVEAAATGALDKDDGERTDGPASIALGVVPPNPPIERTLALWAVLQGALSLEKARRVAPGMPSSVHVGTVATAALLVGFGAQPAAVRRAERMLSDRVGDGKRRS